MTTDFNNMNDDQCPAEDLLKSLTGKWKPQIIKLATKGPVRFNSLLRQLKGSNKQSISVALKELETGEVLIKETIRLKPLHIEYRLSERGKQLVPLLSRFEGI